MLGTLKMPLDNALLTCSFRENVFLVMLSIVACPIHQIHVPVTHLPVENLLIKWKDFSLHLVQKYYLLGRHNLSPFGITAF